MYVGDKPWHGIGKYVGDEAVDAETAIVAGGLDWTVSVRPAYFKATEAELESFESAYRKATDAFLVIRDSDTRVLGHVGAQFTPVQNREAFAFLDAVSGPDRDVLYHTAGSLKGGRRVWLLATIKGMDPIEPVKGDQVEPYLLLANGHDGYYRLRCLFTTVRVVCQNTLHAALQEGKDEGITLRHTCNVMERVKEAQEVLGLARSTFEAFGEEAKVLARKQMTVQLWNDFLDEIAPIPTHEDAKTGYAEGVRDNLVQLFESGPGTDLPGVRGTAWAALNAVTGYTTHGRRTRGGQEGRLESVWFGSGAKLNQKAVEFLRKAA
jgi:phage/plasmid-like protein (TIGR03299 family)